MKFSTHCIDKTTLINLTDSGRPYLGAPIGFKSFISSYVEEKVSEWSEFFLILLNRVHMPPIWLLLTVYLTSGLFLMHTTPHLFRTLVSNLIMQNFSYSYNLYKLHSTLLEVQKSIRKTRHDHSLKNLKYLMQSLPSSL